MITCPVCGIEVKGELLKAEEPKCERGHQLGKWVICEENHVYLKPTQGPPCPICGSLQVFIIVPGTPVKCMYVDPKTGERCYCRKYKWLDEGPPCCLGHDGPVRKDL